MNPKLVPLAFAASVAAIALPAHAVSFADDRVVTPVALGGTNALAASSSSPAVTLHSQVRAHPVAVSAHLAVLAGEVHDPRLGDGAVIYRVTYPQRTFTFVQYTARGTFHGRGHVTIGAPGPDGTSSLTGSARVSGGTGSYRGATGRLGLRGSSTSDFTDTIAVTGGLEVRP